MQDQQTPETKEPETAKRTYERPEIVDYGNVCDLTRGSGTKASDMFSGSRRA